MKRLAGSFRTRFAFKGSIAFSFCFIYFLFSLCVHMYVDSCAYLCTHVGVYMCVHVYVLVYMCMCVYACMYIFSLGIYLSIVEYRIIIIFLVFYYQFYVISSVFITKGPFIIPIIVSSSG